MSRLFVSSVGFRSVRGLCGSRRLVGLSLCLI